jgi:CoA binding domain
VFWHTTRTVVSRMSIGAQPVHISHAIRGLIHQTQRIAVLGIKTERQSFQPAFYVPAYLAHAGFEIIPVPVYFPEVTQILGRPVYRRLIDIPGEIDLDGPNSLLRSTLMVGCSLRLSLGHFS